MTRATPSAHALPIPKERSDPPGSILPTFFDVAAVISYDGTTGQFRWKCNRARTAKQEQLAGSLHPKGYVIIGLFGRLYRAHRVAWLLTFGEWPTGEIDHKNGVRSDNRIDNLRIASRSQNVCNSGRRSDNTSGYKGVSYDRRYNYWVAHITRNGRTKYLGSFKTKEAAHAAYVDAAADLHGEFARMA